MSSRYREIEVTGTPHEMGEHIGEAARDEIRGFAEVALERVNKTVSISRKRAMEVAVDCLAFVEQYAPHMLDELRGVSASSGVSLDDLMLLQVRNQFTPQTDSGGCTSFSAHTTGRSLVGQNWDNDPALDEFTVVLTRRPTDKPALMTITQAGLIAYIGFNDAGIGTCLNTLPAPGRDVGVPHYFTLRGVYESHSLDEAVNAIGRAQRAIPANFMLATPEGPANLEVTLDDVHVLRDETHTVITHTNHCLHPDLIAINDDFDELIQSKPRKRRIDELLSCGDRHDLADFKSALSDHQHYPKSICRHANDDPQTGFWETVLSVIIDPLAGEMHLTRGTPCDHPYEIYRMS